MDYVLYVEQNHNDILNKYIFFLFVIDIMDNVTFINLINKKKSFIKILRVLI